MSKKHHKKDKHHKMTKKELKAMNHLKLMQGKKGGEYNTKTDHPIAEQDKKAA